MSLQHVCEGLVNTCRELGVASPGAGWDDHNNQFYCWRNQSAGCTREIILARRRGGWTVYYWDSLDKRRWGQLVRSQLDMEGVGHVKKVTILPPGQSETRGHVVDIALDFNADRYDVGDLVKTVGAIVAKFKNLGMLEQGLPTGCLSAEVAKPKTEPRQTYAKDAKDPARMAQGAPCSENNDWVTGPLPSIENRKEYWKKYFEYWDQFVQDWFDKKANPCHRISEAFQGLVGELDFNELPEPYQLALHKGTGDFANRKFKAVWLNLNPGMNDERAGEDRKFYSNLNTDRGDLIRAYAEAGSFSGYQKKYSCLIYRTVPGGSTFYADRKINSLGNVFGREIERHEVYTAELCPFHSKGWHANMGFWNGADGKVLKEHILDKVIIPAAVVAKDNNLPYLFSVGGKDEWKRLLESCRIGDPQTWTAEAPGDLQRVWPRHANGALVQNRFTIYHLDLPNFGHMSLLNVGSGQGGGMNIPASASKPIFEKMRSLAQEWSRKSN